MRYIKSNKTGNFGIGLFQNDYATHIVLTEIIVEPASPPIGVVNTPVNTSVEVILVPEDGITLCLLNAALIPPSTPKFK